MTHFQIFKGNYRYVKAYGVFGLVLIILGLWFLFRYLLFPDSREDTLGLAFIIVIISQGLMAIKMSYDSLRRRRYFIEWDDKQIRFWQPRKKEPEFINKNEVVSVEIKNLEVLIRLKEGETKFNLKNLFFPERKKIQEMFEALNQRD